MTYLNDIRVSSKVVGATGVPAGIESLLSAPVQTLRVWYERASQRRRLARLEEHLLRDIGVDRLAAMEEASKPFWQQ